MAFEQTGSGVTEFAPLHTMLYNPFSLWQFGKNDELIRGSAAQNPRPIHTSFSAEVIDKYESKFKKKEIDLIYYLLSLRWLIICSSVKMPHLDLISLLSTSSVEEIMVFHLITSGVRFATYHQPTISLRWKNSSVHIPSSSFSAFTCK